MDERDIHSDILGDLTVRYLRAGSFVISETSGDFDTDRAELLQYVNGVRAALGLEPLPAPDHWPAADEDEV